MLKAIIFDLDDTLIDWGDFSQDWENVERPHLTGVYEYLQASGEPQGDLDAFRLAYFKHARTAWSSARNTLVAPHMGQVLMAAAEALGVADGVTMEGCLKAYNWGAAPGTQIFPDVEDGLTTLREGGLRFGIVTNAFQPMWLRDRELQEHGILDYFPECRFSAADVGHLKPHPNIFAAALNCLELEPDEAVFIGDNPVADIAGAQAAGMRAVLRVNAHAKPMLSGLVIPDGAINSLHELLPILDEWFPGWSG